MVSSGTGSIAKRWRELQGEKSWKGLLEPLDMDLRKSIISYGELVAATGDGFNNEPHSPHVGLCKYGHDDLLTKSGVAAASHYKVTKFVYAWEDSKLTWIGYVAVATDGEGVAALGRRDIVVAWRGSMTGAEWWKDVEVLPTCPWPALGLEDHSVGHGHPCARVHSGFLSLYTEPPKPPKDTNSDMAFFVNGSARDQVLAEVRRLMELHRDEDTSITVVGHSLGSALAILNAIDLVGNGVNSSGLLGGRPPCPVTAIVFACPHVGNDSFRDAFTSVKYLKVLHVKNQQDWVPFLMGWLHDLGVTLHIDTALSHYLKKPNLVTAHSLESYMHAVAGEVGSDGKFRLLVDRDVALVNKSADALKDEYHVPASWWVPHNKNMVKNDQGKWELKDFEQF
jgi:hypothetical protein